MQKLNQTQDLVLLCLWFIASNGWPGVKFYQPFNAKHKCAGLWFWHKKCHPVSTTKLRSTLLVHTFRSYAQLLQCTLFEMHQKDQCKSNGAKAAHNMMMKLTSEDLKTCLLKGQKRFIAILYPSQTIINYVFFIVSHGRKVKAIN